jgi:hypothetical protein
MQSNLSMPLAAGGAGYPTGSSANGDRGYVEVIQKLTLTQNSTNAVSATFYLPYSAGLTGQGLSYPQISEIWVDVTTAFNSATSSTLSVGTAAAGTQFVSGVSCNTAGRVIPTFTGAQLLAMQKVLQGTVVATITIVGATSAGLATVYIRYCTGTSPQPSNTF